MMKQNICPTCKTVISSEELKAWQKTHRLGAALGIVCGTIGAGLGVYFGMIA